MVVIQVSDCSHSVHSCLFQRHSFGVLSGLVKAQILTWCHCFQPPMNQGRIDVINKAFKKADTTGDGLITAKDLKRYEIYYLFTDLICTYMKHTYCNSMCQGKKIRITNFDLFFSFLETMLWLHIILGVTISRDPLLQKAYRAKIISDETIKFVSNLHLM